MKRYLLLASFVCLALLITPRAFAQAGITVAPAFVSLDLSNNKPSSTVSYTNGYTYPVRVNISVDQSYDLANPEPIAPSKWISYNPTSFVLRPGETQKVLLTFAPNKLSPGGHFANLLAQIQYSGAPTGQIQLQAIIATSIALRTHTGNEHDQASIVSLSPISAFWKFPAEFQLVMKNNGNTLVIPYGKLDLSTRDTTLIARGILNTGSLVLFPGATRSFTIPSQNVTSTIWPGVYHATLTVHYSDSNQVLTRQITFFSFGTFPIRRVLAVLGGIGVLCVAFFAYFRVREKQSH